MSNNYGDIGGSLAARYAKDALRHAEPFVVLGKGAKQASQPKKGTRTIRWRQVTPYSAATTALTEGSAPAGTNFRYTTVDGTLLQYGGWTPLTDQAVDFHEADFLKDVNIQNGEQAARTKEALMWAVLGAATNIVYAGGAGSKGATTDYLGKPEIALAVRTLQRNKARMFTEIVKGGVNVGTFPIAASYLCFTHVDSKDDIRAMTNFRPVSAYGSAMKPVSPHEFGAVDEVRFLVSPDLGSEANAGGAWGSTLVSDNSSDANIYTSIVCGQDSYGQVALGGKGAFTPVVRMVGTATASDPLAQTGSMGWKVYSDELILNQNWIVAIKHTVRITIA